jgi:hypothetical protein
MACSKKTIGKIGKRKTKRKKTGNHSTTNPHFGEEVSYMAKKKGKKEKA